MKARLNLTIEAALLERIKKYAAKKHVSVSDLTENYYSLLIDKEKKSGSIFDFLKDVKKNNLQEGFDFKKEYHKHLDKKYGK